MMKVNLGPVDRVSASKGVLIRMRTALARQIVGGPVGKYLKPILLGTVLGGAGACQWVDAQKLERALSQPDVVLAADAEVSSPTPAIEVKCEPPFSIPAYKIIKATPASGKPGESLTLTLPVQAAEICKEKFGENFKIVFFNGLGGQISLPMSRTIEENIKVESVSFTSEGQLLVEVKIRPGTLPGYRGIGILSADGMKIFVILPDAFDIPWVRVERDAGTDADVVDARPDVRRDVVRPEVPREVPPPTPPIISM